MNEVKKILFVGVADVINGSVIESNVDSTLLTKAISIAQEMGLKPILGSTLYNQLYEASEAKMFSGVTPTDLMQNLLDTSKPYLIAKTVADFIIINNYKFTNKGIMKLNDNSGTSLDNTDLESVKDYYTNLVSTYKGDVIQFLKDNNIINYNNDVKLSNTGWFTGKKSPRLNNLRNESIESEYITYSASSTVGNTSFTYEQIELFRNELLITEGEIKAESVIQNNCDALLLTRTIQSVQDVYLKPILGENIYYETLNSIYQQKLNNAALKPLYSDLLTIIKPYLTNKVVAEFIIPNQYKFTNKGLLKLNDNSATALDNSDLESIKQYYENISSTYKANIIDYLLKNHLTNGNTDTRIGNSGWFTGKKGFPNRGCSTSTSPVIGSTYTDTFTTGGTYSNGVILLKDNQGGVYEIDGLYTGSTDTDIYLTGGTYAAGVINLYDNSGSTISIEGLYTGSTGSTSTQSWQDTLIVNPNLSQDNIIDAGDNNFSILNTNETVFGVLDKFHIVTSDNVTDLFTVDTLGQLSVYGNWNGIQQQTLFLSYNGELAVIGNNKATTLDIDGVGNFTLQGIQPDLSDANQTLLIEWNGNFQLQGNGGEGSPDNYDATLQVTNQGLLNLYSVTSYGGEHQQNQTLQIDTTGYLTLYGDSNLDGTGFNQTFNVTHQGELSVYSNIDGSSNQTLLVNNDGSLNLKASTSTFFSSPFVDIFSIGADGSVSVNSSINGITNSTFAIGNSGGMAVWGDDNAENGSNFQQVLGVSPNGLFVTYSNIDGNQNRTLKVTENGNLTLYGDRGANDGTFFNETFIIDEYGTLSLNTFDGSNWNNTLYVGSNIVTLSSVNGGDIDISSVGNLLLNANNSAPLGTITLNAGNKLNLQSINGATFTDSKGLTFIANSITGFTLDNTGIVRVNKDMFVNGVSIGKGTNSLVNNIAIGASSLSKANSGNGNNVAIGLSALTLNTSGWANTAIGATCMTGNTTGLANTAIGYDTLMNNSTGQFNTAVGVQALYTNNGTHNTALGFQSLFYNTSGQQNTGFGSYALMNNTVGQFNIGIGYYSLHNNVSGSSNTAIGVTAMGANGLTSSNNTAIGWAAGHGVYGNNGVYIGYQAGNNGAGDGNVFIGYQAGINETGANKLYITNNSSSTPLIGGDFAANTVTINGSLKSTSTVTASKFQLSALNTAPANSGDTGTTGEIRVVNGFIYVCVATNTWQRATLSTF